MPCNDISTIGSLLNGITIIITTATKGLIPPHAEVFFQSCISPYTAAVILKSSAIAVSITIFYGSAVALSGTIFNCRSTPFTGTVLPEVYCCFNMPGLVQSRKRLNPIGVIHTIVQSSVRVFCYICIHFCYLGETATAGSFYSVANLKTAVITPGKMNLTIIQWCRCQIGRSWETCVGRVRCGIPRLIIIRKCLDAVSVVRSVNKASVRVISYICT